MSICFQESSTGALLSFPFTSDGPLYDQYFDVAPSQFGYQKWGGTLTGYLILPANETYHTECPKCSNSNSSMCNQNGNEPIGTCLTFMVEFKQVISTNSNLYLFRFKPIHSFSQRLDH